MLTYLCYIGGNLIEAFVNPKFEEDPWAGLPAVPFDPTSLTYPGCGPDSSVNRPQHGAHILAGQAGEQSQGSNLASRTLESHPDALPDAVATSANLLERRNQVESEPVQTPGLDDIQAINEEALGGNDNDEDIL